MKQTSIKKETSIDWLMAQLYKKGFIKEVDESYPKGFFDFKIIIPQEETTPVWKQIIEDCGGEEAFMEAAGLKPKQETLEETCNRLYNSLMEEIRKLKEALELKNK